MILYCKETLNCHALHSKDYYIDIPIARVIDVITVCRLQLQSDRLKYLFVIDLNVVDSITLQQDTHENRYML